MRSASWISGDLERLGRPLKRLYIDRKRSFPDFLNSLLQKVLGHKKKETTLKYIHAVHTSLRETMLKTQA